jgi:hypothetical protein
MKKLQIGLIMDSLDIFAWEYVLLEKIIGSDYGAISLVILNDSFRKKSAGSLKRYCSNLFYKLFWKFEDIKHKPSPNAFEIKNSKILLTDIPTLRVMPNQTKFSDRLKTEDIEKLIFKNIDVFIIFGFPLLGGEILNVGKFGVWSYDHGYIQNNKNIPAGLWEAVERHPTTCSMLRILDGALRQGRVIYSSYSTTDYFSVNKTCNRHYWKIVSFIPRKLKELYTFGDEKFFQRVEQDNKMKDLNCTGIVKIHTSHQFIFGMIKYLFRSIKIGFLKKIFFEQWILLFDLQNDFSYSFSRYKKIIPPKDRLYADPHLICKGGKYYIFFEEKLFETGKGHISLIVMDEQGNYGKPIKVIDNRHHLSYPFVFKWKDQYFMIPESSENKTIPLYKCVHFPEKWKFQKNLMENVVAADTTLYYYDRKWWLFTNIKENEGSTNWDELFLFYAESPFSESWKAHPINPIISDVRKARPAGKIFHYNGKIYRPSQNSSRRYGYGLKINLIVKLSEFEYEEIEIRSIEPNWDKHINGVHSFSKERNLTVIDGKFKRPRYFGKRI